MLSAGAIDPRPFLDATAVLTGIAVALGSLEDLVRYAAFSDDGLMSWKVVRLRSRWIAGGRTGAAADAVLSFPRYRWVIAARLAAALAVIPFSRLGGAPQAALFLALSGAAIAENIRCPYGQTGAQQMTLVLCIALFLANLAPDGHAVQRICLWFIALQATLAYLTSGLSKLASARWRSGEALVGIMGTTIYGNRPLHRVLQRWRALPFVASWGTMLFESCFFLVFLGCGELTLALIATALLFHLTVAFAMGLNLFFWAFLATYPAILFCTSLRA